MTDTTDTARALANIRWARRTDQVCPSCTQPFAAKSRQIYCSNRCRQAAKYRRQREIKRG